MSIKLILKKHIPHIKPALVLTPAIFLLVFWVLTLSSSDLVATVDGIYKLTLMALPLSFCVAYSIAMFVHEMLHPNE